MTRGKETLRIGSQKIFTKSLRKFKSLVIIVGTANLTLKNSTSFPHFICVLCGCQNIKWIFPCTAFRYLFLSPRWQVLLCGTNWTFR